MVGSSVCMPDRRRAGRPSTGRCGTASPCVDHGNDAYRDAVSPQPFLRRVIDENPALLREFYDLTHENTALAFRLLSNLSVRPSERRLGSRPPHYNELSADDCGWLNLSQDHLASLVAVSLPTMQRILRRFVEEGLVELSYRKLRVLDSDRLAALCRD